MTAHPPTDYEVECASGVYVDVSNPDPATIRLEDIAHALSQTCRFGGHCRVFYSVAEHAVFVSRRLERKGHSDELLLAALHHDDSEYCLGDIPRPMKPLLGYGYEAMTDKMDEAIAKALKLPTNPEFHEAIKEADTWSLFVEARYLLPSQGKGWWDGEQGSFKWGLSDLPSRIVTPDYWLGGILPAEAMKLYLERHALLTERLES